jgi:lactate dehydrogenase-like 2-hydroxyacid dehydrogenase
MATKPDVLVVAPNRPDQMKMLDEAYTLHRLYKAQDREALLNEVAPIIRAVVTGGRAGFKKEMLEQLPNLEIVAANGVGVDSIDVEECRARGIPVTNTPDVLTDDVADMGMALTYATLRGFARGERWVREGRWKNEGMMPLATCIKGKVLGIIGLGRIGKAIAARAESFGMEVRYNGRRAQADVAFRFYDDAVALARDADVLLLACPGGEATRNLVSNDILEALGPTGHLVNISRGSVVDEPALLEALQNNRIAGAGLDVYENEPRIDEAFFPLDNVVLQPHCASATVETRDAMAQLVVDNLAAHFAGKPLLTAV